jgi:endonuclease YncB( thermonuclease family)
MILDPREKKSDDPRAVRKRALRRRRRRVLRGWSQRTTPASRRVIGLIALAIMGAIVFVLATGPQDEAVVGPVRVVSGDKLRVAGETYHLAGIAAPPLDYFCRDEGLDIRCGEQARDAMREIINATPVRCVRLGDGAGGPIAARCFREGRDLAGAIVLAGYALSLDEYRNEQIEARAEKRGLWAMEFDEDDLRAAASR